MVSRTRSVEVALQILVGFPGSSLMHSRVVEGFVVFALVFLSLDEFVGFDVVVLGFG